MFQFNADSILKNGETIAITDSVYIKNTLKEHTHDFLEIAYIYQGTGYHFINDKKHYIKAGDLLLISKNSNHNYYNDTDELRWYNIVFTPDAISKNLFNNSSLEDIFRLYAYLGIIPFSCTKIEDVFIKNKAADYGYLIASMHDEYRDKKEGYQFILSNYLSIVMTKIFRSLSQNEYNVSDDYNPIIEEIIQYLNTHSQKPSDILPMLSAKNISASYFPKYFKSKTGMSLNKFMQQYRIRSSCNLLLNSDKCILDIIDRVGYSDTKFFYKIFKEYTGMTPLKYRNKYCNVTK